MEEEIWRMHPDMTKYEFSNFGNFRKSDTKKILKNSISNGYIKTFLFNDKLNKRVQCKIHRMVALLFIPLVDGKTHVNHKDGVKNNNHYSNLEWSTNQENIRHSIDTGLRKRSPAQKLNENLVREIRNLYDSTNLSMNQLAKKYSVNGNSISLLLKYKSYTNVDPELKFKYKINQLDIL